MSKNLNKDEHSVCEIKLYPCNSVVAGNEDSIQIKKCIPQCKHINSRDYRVDWQKTEEEFLYHRCG
jgi:phage FluMu protein Com